VDSVIFRPSARTENQYRNYTILTYGRGELYDGNSSHTGPLSQKKEKIDLKDRPKTKKIKKYKRVMLWPPISALEPLLFSLQRWFL